MRKAMMATALLAAMGGASAAGAAEPSLTEAITAQDRKLFDAYNACALDAFEAAFAPDVEFYHDEGGVTWERQSVIDSTRKYICGKVRRELIPGTLRVYPIKDFGAIEEGEHRFCQKDQGCAGIAKFVIVWKREGDGWIVTRVLSYGHRAATAEER
ncbi:MAG: nuclear transport factor 2 family protein [Caulobacter sp.]